jgi:hypothetical protein
MLAELSPPDTQAADVDDRDVITMPRLVPCPQCGFGLDLHQPDLDNPDRLIGICPDSGAWYQVRLARHGRWEMIYLP